MNQRNTRALHDDDLERDLSDNNTYGAIGTAEDVNKTYDLIGDGKTDKSFLQLPGDINKPKSTGHLHPQRKLEDEQKTFKLTLK